MRPAKRREIIAFAMPFVLGIPLYALYVGTHPDPTPPAPPDPGMNKIFGYSDDGSHPAPTVHHFPDGWPSNDPPEVYKPPSPTAIILATKCKDALQSGRTFVERMDNERRCLCRHVSDGVDPKMCHT